MIVSYLIGMTREDEMSEHTKDSDCTVGDDGLCIECGVDHSDPCENCGGAGFHKPDCISIGDFVEVPAWDVIGCVMEMRPPTMGSDDAKEIRLQLDCDAPESEWKWFRVEPGEYRVQ